jgi:hypothetical protein
MQQDLDAKRWCENGIAAVLSLWDANDSTAWRSSNEMSAHAKHPSTKKDLYPTATAHAVLAFGSCGLWSGDSKADPKHSMLTTPFFDIPTDRHVPDPRKTLKALLCGAFRRGPARAAANPRWVKRLLTSSSHTSSSNANKNLFSPRVAILLGYIMSAIRVLACAPASSLYPADLEILLQRADQLVDHVLKVFGFSASSRAPTEVDLLSNQLLSPHLLLHAAFALKDREAIRTLVVKPRSPSRGREQAIISFENTLKGYFRRQIDFHMARHGVDADHEYDPISLAFSLRALSLLDARFRQRYYLQAAVEVVVASQRADGCWPEGISVAYLPTGDSLQQPSVEVALDLSETVFHESLLVRIQPGETALLQKALPALRRYGAFLAASFRTLDSHNPHASGWASDRVRSPHWVEMWITAMATRLFRNLWLTEQACQRADILSRYSAYWPDQRHKPSGPNWLNSVVDPDSVTKPVQKLHERIVLPIDKQSRGNVLFCQPEKDAVAAILYGPPGSGKTFFVTQLASAIGWPRITITPGHFIDKGIEVIESRTSAVFHDLTHLKHAVVFFDECDELFRDRDDTKGSNRNILSFVTACMLPKLQQLHDERNIILMLGTNYVSRIDSAVRRQGRFDFILLFDRPDRAARRHILTRELARLHARKPTPKELTDLVIKTNGYLTKEVMEVAKQASKARVTNFDQDVSDYVYWCNTWGLKELKAAGVKDDTARKIVGRWKTLSGVKKFVF